jgi:prepilin-type N-terminal cleavage/methylation domain-containing protein
LFNSAAFTLLEVVVALAVFALILGVSGLAVASLREPPQAATNRELIAARDSAVRTGRPVTVAVDPSHWTFLPDGRAIGPGLDPLTGASRAKP